MRNTILFGDFTLLPQRVQGLVRQQSLVAFIVISASAAFFGLWILMWRDSSLMMNMWREEVFMKTGGQDYARQLYADIHQTDQVGIRRSLQTFHPSELAFAERLLSVGVMSSLCAPALRSN